MKRQPTNTKKQPPTAKGNKVVPPPPELLQEFAKPEIQDFSDTEQTKTLSRNNGLEQTSDNIQLTTLGAHTKENEDLGMATQCSMLQVDDQTDKIPVNKSGKMLKSRKQKCCCIVMIILVLVVGAAAYFFMFQRFWEKDEEDEETAKAAEKQDSLTECGSYILNGVT